VPPDTSPLLLDSLLLLLIGIANAAPLFGHTLLRQRWAWPLDGGKRFFDGHRLLGNSKTIRGVVLALLITPVTALLLGLPPMAGVLIGSFAMIGDVLSSFTKRRLGLPPHSQALGLDQVPECLLPLLAVQPLFDLTMIEVLVMVAAFVVLELAISKVLYRLRLRDQPY
jgi:hypothetical protein